MAWQTLEETQSTLLQCELHPAGGGTIRYLTTTQQSGWSVALTVNAMQALRRLLAGEPNGLTYPQMATCLQAEGYMVYSPDTTLPYDTWALIGEREGYSMPRAMVLDMLVAEGYGIISPSQGPESGQPVEPPTTEDA